MNCGAEITYRISFDKEDDNNLKINRNVPVICAECNDTGQIVKLKDGDHLTCKLMNDKPIYGSKPKWCPKGELFTETE